jgi:hypothetical protein
MSAAAEVQAGTAYIYGIAPLTITPSGGSAITGNIANVRVTDEWQDDEITSQNGAVIETSIGSRRKRTIEFDFAPKGTARSDAIAAAAAILALTPNQVITIASDTLTALNGTYNFKSGGTITRTRDGIAVSSIKLVAYETAGTGGTFAALAIAS